MCMQEYDCVRGSERESARALEHVRARESERESLCACVCGGRAYVCACLLIFPCKV